MRGLLIAILVWGMALPTYADGVKYAGPVKLVGPNKHTAPVATTTGWCGALAGGAAAPNQSGCGNVAPFSAAPSSPTAIGSFPNTPGAGGNYQLTADCSLGGSTVCLTLNNTNTVLDLNGHTVNGRIICQFNCNGLVIYSSVAGAIHTCASLNSTAVGCLSIQDSGVSNPTVTIHHITTSNTVDASGANAAYYGYVDWGTPTGTLTLNIYNVTSSMSGAGDASTQRLSNWRLQGAENTDIRFHDNDITCGASTPVCQGVEVFQPYGQFYNNYFHFPTNVSAGDSPRAIACDGNAGVVQSGICNVYNNFFDDNNGRAFRFRNRYGARFHDNRIDNANTATGEGQLHIGDPDSGDNLNMDFDANNNTFRVQSGNVLMMRSATGVTLQNNTVECIASCTNGRFAYVRTPVGTVSVAIIRNNPTVSGIGFTNENTTDASGVLNRCNSGTANGAGTNNSVSC